MLLAGDGSPFPIINSEKHKTVGHYLIQYRSVATGIPVFLVNTHNKCGRGKADIMDNPKDWTGNVFMCDAYAGYDWMKKIDGLVLCRSVGSYVLKNIKTTPNDKLYTLLPEFWEDEG